jgi:hypothetical protein
MTNPDPFKSYLADLQNKLSTGGATEHSHRSTLEALIEALGDGIQAINEPRRIECGAPDLVVLKDGRLVGHIEAKDIGKSLDTVERSDQLTRYRRLFLSIENRRPRASKRPPNRPSESPYFDCVYRFFYAVI